MLYVVNSKFAQSGYKKLRYFYYYKDIIYYTNKACYLENAPEQNSNGRTMVCRKCRFSIESTP